MTAAASDARTIERRARGGELPLLLVAFRCKLVWHVDADRRCSPAMDDARPAESRYMIAGPSGPVLFLRWVLTLHLGPRLSIDRRLVRLLGHWRMSVFGDLALLSTAWYAALHNWLDSGVDLPSLLFLNTRNKYQWPSLTPRLPHRWETDMEYARCVEIACSMQRWRPRQTKHLRGSGKKETAHVSYWRDGSIKKLTRSIAEHAFPFCARVVQSRRASDPAISTVPRAWWYGGTRDDTSISQADTAVEWD